MSLSTIFLVIIGVLAIGGFLIGLLKGTNRSVLSLVLVVLSFVLMLAFKDTIINAIMGIQIQGATLEETIYEAFANAEGLETLADTIVPIVKIILGLIIFVVGFLVLRIATSFIFHIGAIFVKKNKTHKGAHTLVGGAIGLLEGVFFAFVICVPLSGLILEANKLAGIEFQTETASLESIEFDEDGNPLLTAEEGGEGSEGGSGSIQDSVELGFLNELLALVEKLDIDGYQKSPIGSVINGMGKDYFTQISKTTNKEGRIITLSGQVDSIVAAAEIAEHVSTLGQIDFSGELTADTVHQVADILRQLEEIKNSSSEEVITTIDNLIDMVMGLIEGEESGINLPEFSLEKINFAVEADLIESCFDLVNEDGEVNIEDINFDEIIDNLSKSNLILPIFESVAEEMELRVDGEIEVKLTESIEKLDDVASKNRLYKLFHIVPAQ